MEPNTSRAEEIEALCAIYGDELKVEDEQQYSITLKENGLEAIFFINLPSDYPDPGVPTFYLQAPSLSRFQKQQIALSLNDIYLEHFHEPVVYDWIEKLRELLQEYAGESQEKQENSELHINVDPEEKHEHNIHHGPLIHDRKSHFQGHVTTVQFENEVQKIMDELKENRKIAEATHNILAYRIKRENGGILQDYDDDGETNAGRRVLHLLEILDLSNVLVVVSRWYGGIHLGPDRFKHINNAARQVLVQAGYVKNK